MPDPTGRWINRKQWQCPNCSALNDLPVKRCQTCERSVSPAGKEPVRPFDPLDLIGPRRREEDGPTDDPETHE